MKITARGDKPLLETCGLEGIDYQLDTYLGCQHHCHYCYALNTAETDWTKEIQIHADLESRLGSELAGLPPQKVYLGYKTDPYQPLEAEQKQTRKALQVMAGMGFSASILTKSNLMLRDLELFRSMPDANLGISVAFGDGQTRQRFEANTMDTAVRIEALAQLKKAGISTSALLCPVIPHITPVLELVEQLAGLADKIWVYGLSIQNRQDINWRNIKPILDQHYAGLKREIEEIIINREHVYWSELRRQLQDYKTKQAVNLLIRL